jgi:hypothetical protein
MDNFLQEKKVISKIAGLILLFFCFFGLITGFLLRNNLLYNEEVSLEKLTKQAENDLDYAGGKWNTAKYNADPSTPHPSGSSGFGSSLYIITADGFVIERTQPVNGILDSADFKHLMTFNSPQTLNIVTNEQWRVLSRPIQAPNGTTIGVIMVAYLNPPAQVIQSIDEKLQKNLAYIASATTIKNDEVDISRVDIRDVDYDISFEVVNHFNRVLLNTGRVPTYIDPSYVEQEMAQKEGIMQFKDKLTGKTYLLHKEHLSDAAGKPVGVIIAGKSIDYIADTLKNLFLPAIISTIIVSILLTALLYRFAISPSPEKKEEEHPRKNTSPEFIVFDAESSVLTLDDRTVQIPYATNQYELAKAVFSAPTKRWELDELLELFGETENLSNWRKVYDATLALNKKSGLKLVIYKDKTFRLNPEFIPHIKK